MQAIMKTKDEELNYFKKELGSMRGKVEEVFTENVELKKEVSVYSQLLLFMFRLLSEKKPTGKL